MKLLVVGDSDSYVKWGAALAATLPRDWEWSLVVLRSPVRPSRAQLESALLGTGMAAAEALDRTLEQLPALIDAIEPDAVLAAVRGPVVRVVARAVQAARGRRPVFVSGLPGITIPAVPKAIRYRAHADLVVLHSHREVRDFRALASEIGCEQRFGLATLPFIPRQPLVRSDGASAIVFAAQAMVPREMDERMLLLGWLAECARRHADRRVVVKLRAAAGESQTHAETYDYESLAGRLVPPAPPNLVFEGGSMSKHLARAGALVTVSSTAAVEAVAAGIPVLLLDDFGVSPRLINTVFEGSGLFGGSDDLVNARFRHVAPGWSSDNYLHGRDDDTWQAALAELVQLRDAGALPWRVTRERVLGGGLRLAWDRRRALGDHDTSALGAVAVAIGVPVRGAVRLLRRVRARPRGDAATPHPSDVGGAVQIRTEEPRALAD